MSTHTHDALTAVACALSALLCLLASVITAGIDHWRNP